MQNRFFVRKLTTMAMLCALAYVAMLLIHIPVAGFLTYDPKDVIIAIGGFMFGPLACLLISATVSFLEMITISSTGWIGFAMNTLATCAFACTASFIYRRRRNIRTAVVGLLAGVAVMTAVMLLWNYILTPLYLNIPRSEVVKMLVPTLLPFNLLKSSLNSGLIMLIYKPTTRILRKMGLMPEAENESAVTGKTKLFVMLMSSLVIALCVLFVLMMQGKL